MSTEMPTAAALFTMGIALVTTGVETIRSGDLLSGAAITLSGFGVVGVGVYVLERGVAKTVMKALRGS